MHQLSLRRGRDTSLLRRHPWIFSGAVQRVDGDPPPGATVRVLDADGRALGYAAYSPSSQIRARMWSFDPAETVDAALLRSRIAAAGRRRAPLLASSETTACRLIASEADGLPGFIVDRYDRVLVCQFLSAGAEYWRETLLDILHEAFPGTALFERSDSDAREKEGLPARSGPLRGATLPEFIPIREHGLRFRVDVRSGHKTGAYLDQRENRALLRQHADGAAVLNCFSYTGGFALHALAGGAAHVTDVDVSRDALRLAADHVRENGFDDSRYAQHEADVFHFLRSCRDARRQYDVIVLDPPKFAASGAQVQRASRGYKDINLLAMKLLRPGGMLFTFSCSGHMTEPLFRKIVAGAAIDAGREVQVLAQLAQSMDHPVVMHIPESWYLKGYMCRVGEDRTGAGRGG